jgi:hypothetical protein
LDNAPPVVGYESARSTLEQLDGAVLYRLTRPPSWPKIIALSILVAFSAWMCLLACAILATTEELFTNWLRAVPVIFVGGALLCTGIYTLRQLIRRLEGIRRAGRRPFVVAVHEGRLYVEDPHDPASLTVVDPREIIAIELRSIWGSRPQTWDLRIVRARTRQVKLEFVEPDAAAAETIRQDLCALLGLSAT